MGQYNWLIMTHKGCYANFSMVDAHMGTKEFITGPLDANIASLYIRFIVHVWLLLGHTCTQVYSIFLKIAYLDFAYMCRLEYLFTNNKVCTLQCVCIYKVWNVVKKAGQVA